MSLPPSILPVCLFVCLFLFKTVLKLKHLLFRSITIISEKHLTRM